MSNKQSPDKVYAWWDDTGEGWIYGLLPPSGVYVVEYTVNNMGYAHLSVVLSEET